MFGRSGIILVLTALLPGILRADSIAVPVPGGTIWVEVSHAGPSGQLAEASPPVDAGFRPPTIFAAPLPTGSGARALGLAGAFTAVSDDATAASWNPAGLTQLERPEVSAVYRFSSQTDTHESGSRDLLTDRDQYNNSELNYASAVYPFLLNERNAVVSLNYQEAYDFTQVFTARFQGSNQQTVNTVTNQNFSGLKTSGTSNDTFNITLTTLTTTLTESQIDQLLSSSLLTDIDFRQSGSIDAISPAFAMEVTPRLSLGIAFNIYTDGASRGNPIESSLTADYSGTSESYAEITDIRNSTSVLNWFGTSISPYGSTNSFSGTLTTNLPESVTTYTNTDNYSVAGSYQEHNKTDQFYGFNATLGALWTATDHLTLGASVDLPWTGRGKQTKLIQHQMTTFDSNSVAIAQGSYQSREQRDVEYTFPLYWALGGVWRWNDRFYTSMDVSCTHWSQYSYKAEGEKRINPLNGEPYSASALDDCWSVRMGGEYLCVLSWTEIPLRGGVFWEQRPAVGTPDQYWGFSLGSGISLGKEPGKIILDIAYTFEHGENVMGSLLPGQGMSSDVDRHQVFVSTIWHF